MKTFSQIRLLAILLFGAIFPSVVLYSAFSDISELTDRVDYKGDLKNAVHAYDSVTNGKDKLVETNQYILLSLFITENANQNAMVNKQVMKTAVMQIGFALISIGMLFIMLGFNDGGIDGAGSVGEFSFDFKIGSSGLAAFTIGAVMVTLGGVLKNEYNTVPIPNYTAKLKSLTLREYIGITDKCKIASPGNINQCVVAGLNAKNKGK